jgi:hypothetical protein
VPAPTRARLAPIRGASFRQTLILMIHLDNGVHVQYPSNGFGWPLQLASVGAAVIMTCARYFVIAGAVGMLAASLFAPHARADIFEVEAATACPGTGCNGNVPYKLSALLTQLESPNSILNGTQKYVVTNDVGNSFSFVLDSTGQNNTGVANNGACQINGGAKSFFSACSIVDKLSHKTSLGATQINNLTFAATVMFSGTSLGDTFTLGFVSMQGSSEVAATPIPGALPLFAGGLGVLSVLGWRKKRKTAAA